MHWRPSLIPRLPLFTTLAAALALAGCGGGEVAPGDARSDARLDGASDARMDATGDLPADIADVQAVGDVVDVVDAARPCTSAADCAGNPAGNACDTATGRCVQCVAAADTCPAAEHCDDSTHTCVPGCRSDDGCAGTSGDGGVSTARCDTTSHTCVECVTNDHCPLGQLCMGNRCVAGCDAMRGCPAGQTCCAGGCVDTQTNTAHCGACGATCTVANGAPACTAGACAVGSCTMPYADCNRRATDGCETNTQTDVANCGACGMACPPRPNATASCAMGMCEYACEAGFADCNGDAADGCEVDTRSNPSHCGTCGRACSYANATALCAAGMCALGACNMGFGDCDGMAANGCEADQSTDVANCGACGTVCPARPNASPVCAAGRCGITCAAGFADCDGVAANGCEVNLNTSATNCGMCGQACSFANASATCMAGTCALGTCNPGFADCNGSASDGCEVNTGTNVNNCGVCGRVCRYPFASATCSGGTCALGACNTGFANCNGDPADGCEIDTNNNVDNCGACGRVCSFPNASPVCSSGACTLGACSAGYANCNGLAADGCEANLGSVSNCGACGRVCSIPNGAPACTAGTCTIAACNPGFADCNGSASDGCETALNTNTNCGACGRACGVGTTCSAGVCVSICPPGTTFCGGSCANLTSDPNNCGACGRVCSFPNASPMCSGGACAIAACNAGFGNCNGVTSDGCETALNTNTNCGACGRVCAAGQVCSGGTCVATGPANDTRAGATVISMSAPQSLLVTDTSSATNNTTGTCGCTSGRDVFFTFTIPPGPSEIVYADTIGASWDTSLFFQDAAGANITTPNITNGLTCDDDIGLSGCNTGLQSQVMARLNPGTYYLVLSGCGWGPATVRFQHLPVGNGSLTLLGPGSSATVSGTTSGSGIMFGCTGVGPENTYFWYSCQSYAGGAFSASTCGGASWDTVLYQRSASRSPTEICNDDACSVQSNISGSIPSGPGLHTLYIDGFGSTSSGAYTITYTRP